MQDDLDLQELSDKLYPSGGGLTLTSSNIQLHIDNIIQTFPVSKDFMRTETKAESLDQTLHPIKTYDEGLRFWNEGGFGWRSPEERADEKMLLSDYLLVHHFERRQAPPQTTPARSSNSTTSAPDSSQSNSSSKPATSSQPSTTPAPSTSQPPSRTTPPPNPASVPSTTPSTAAKNSTSTDTPSSPAGQSTRTAQTIEIPPAPNVTTPTGPARNSSTTDPASDPTPASAPTSSPVPTREYQSHTDLEFHSIIFFLPNGCLLILYFQYSYRNVIQIFPPAAAADTPSTTTSPAAVATPPQPHPATRPSKPKAPNSPDSTPSAQSHESTGIKKEIVIIGIASVAAIILVVLGFIIFKIQMSRRQQRRLEAESQYAAANLHAASKPRRDSFISSRPVPPSVRRDSFINPRPVLPPVHRPAMEVSYPPPPPRTAYIRPQSNNAYYNQATAFRDPRPPPQPPMNVGRANAVRPIERWNHQPQRHQIDDYHHEDFQHQRESNYSADSRHIDARYTLNEADHNFMHPDDRPYNPHYTVDRRGQLRYEYEDEVHEDEESVYDSYPDDLTEHRPRPRSDQERGYIPSYYQSDDTEVVQIPPRSRGKPEPPSPPPPAPAAAEETYWLKGPWDNVVKKIYG